MTEIFPISLPCNQKGWSEHAFRKAFMDAKPEGLIWYGYDTIIHSPFQVEFVVYDMHDNVSGGLGKQIANFKATVFEETTRDAIDRRIMALAAARRHRELKQTEDDIIRRYADEIRASTLPPPQHSTPEK